jgi:hypothetical protein
MSVAALMVTEKQTAQNEVAVVAEAETESKNKAASRQLILDTERLEAFIQRAVAETAGYSVDELDRLRVMLQTRIWAYRQSWDRSALMDVSIETNT